jgi:flagellar operon protein
MINSIDRLPPITKPTSVESVKPTRTADTVSSSKAATQFHDVFSRELVQNEQLTFSNHAQSRLLSRQIQLSNNQMERLQQGVQQAAQKGAKDSLVMLDNLAFIVSVPNRTVVTALDGAAKTGNVFTQIDSAVIV